MDISRPAAGPVGAKSGRSTDLSGRSMGNVTNLSGRSMGNDTNLSGRSPVRATPGARVHSPGKPTPPKGKSICHSGAMKSHEDFAGPGLEVDGFRTYAYLTSGRRVLIRRRVGERIEITAAGRRFFERFRAQAASPGMLPCGETLEGTPP